MGKEGRNAGRGRGGGRGNNRNSGGSGGGGRGGLSSRGRGGGGGGGRFGNRGGGGGGRHAGGRGGHGGRGSGGGGGGGHQNKALSGAIEATLQLIFEKYPVYNNEMNMLRLSQLNQVDELRKVSNTIDFNNTSFCNALANVISKMFPGTSFIDFSSNRMSNPNAILRSLRDKGLHSTIRGFSFADNNIKEPSNLFILSSFKNLHEIVVGGNPVTQQATAKRLILQKIPWLQMLDGEAIEEVPLGLPWPVTPNLDDPGKMEVLTFIQELLSNLADNGPDAVMGVYHENATFSLSIHGGAPYNGKKFANQAAFHALRDLRQQQEKSEHDLKGADGARAKIAVGRNAICGALKRMLYNNGNNIRCTHGLNTDAHVVRMSQGVPAPVILVTIHGVISWMHQSDQNTKVSNAFDRTFTLVPSNGQGPAPFFVANDMLSLRSLEVDAAQTSQVVWFPTNPQYIKKHVRDGTVCNNADLVSTIAEQCKSETELFQAKDEVNRAGNAVGEALSLSAGDHAVAVKILRIVGRTGCPPGKAAEALKASNGNLDEASTKASA